MQTHTLTFLSALIEAWKSGAVAEQKYTRTSVSRDSSKNWLLLQLQSHSSENHN